MVNVWFLGFFLLFFICFVGWLFVFCFMFFFILFFLVILWDEWRVWVKDGGWNEDLIEVIWSEGNVRRWYMVNGIGYVWFLVVWCCVIFLYCFFLFYCCFGFVCLFIMFFLFILFYFEWSDWNGVGRSWVEEEGG